MPAESCVGDQTQLERRPLGRYRDQEHEGCEKAQIRRPGDQPDAVREGMLRRGPVRGGAARAQAHRGKRHDPCAGEDERGEDQHQVDGAANRPDEKRARSPAPTAPSDAPAPTSPNRRRACRVSKRVLANVHAWTGAIAPKQFTHT